jgi:predicted ABC-class ATPase
MLPADRLRDKLIVANGKSLQAYRDLQGAYRFERFELHLDTVHLDPAGPSCSARVRVDQAEAQVPRDLWASPTRRIAVQDFLARGMRDAVTKHVKTRWSGRIAPVVVDAGGQEILARTCCTVEEDYVEMRLRIALPAEGRKVVAKPAQALLFTDLPAAVDAGMRWAALDGAAGRRHCETYEDYLALRDALPQHGLVAFVADGSVPGREPGPGDRPLRGSRAVPTRAPEDLAVEVTLPHRGPVRGLGIRRGITLVTGSLYSGKSTLLAAIASGVYAHIPGDGRELIATVPDAVVVRADPGRRIERVDVSAFVHALPHAPDLTALSMERATGTLSMVASVAEALELGTGLLLFDEDDSAIAFVARDPVMQDLIPKARDVFTPLVERARTLWEAHGVSTIIATSGLGEYLDIADTVIVVADFQLTSATARARSLASGRPGDQQPPPRPFDAPAPRVPLARGFAGMKGRGLRAELRGRTTLAIGRDLVDLASLPHLVDPSQARAAGDAIVYAVEKGYIDGQATVGEIIDRVFAEIEASGLGVLAIHPDVAATYAMPRKHEVAAILNRLRSLQVRTRQRTDTVSEPVGGPTSAGTSEASPEASAAPS